MLKLRGSWMLWLLGIAFSGLIASAVCMRMFAPYESIGRLPATVMIETAASALNAGNKQTGCGRSQYEDVPHRLSEHEFRFQPKQGFEKKCPYVTIGVDPYWGDVASVVEERN
jgi:hypothetical protein